MRLILPLLAALATVPAYAHAATPNAWRSS